MRTRTRFSILTALGAMLALSSATAGAVAYCNDAGPHPDGLSNSDVNYSPTGSAPFVDATDCYGYVTGNIQPSTTLSIWGGSWQFADANNEPSGTASLFGGQFEFTLSALNDDPSGVYTLAAVDLDPANPPNLPLYLDFVIGLKAGNGYALYYFDEVLFDGSGGGEWWVKFDPNPAGKFPGLSHMTAFVREGTEPPCRPDDPTCNPPDVPEPGTLALMGLGLLGLGLGRRRRK